MNVRARMAPSPTGKLHVGTAHTSLFNFLFARHNKGVFVLRIDDSDPVRSKKEFEENIIESLKWLGIYWDEGPDVGGPYAPYRESDRTESYRKYVDKLLGGEKAYRCFCTKEELEDKRKKIEETGGKYRYDGKCRDLKPDEVKKFLSEGKPFAVRLINPNKVVTFRDMVRGEISVDTTDLGDFIIVRSDGSALLNFAVVIDDIEMKITHVIRGEDFLNATPLQLLVYEALGEKPPEIANLSFIYAPDHTKLSKRHGATGVDEYREKGYLPEALVNFLAFIGWNPGDEREIFTLTELIDVFDLKRVQKSMPTFNIVKLNWYNQQYIKSLSNSDLAKRLTKFTKRTTAEIEKVLPLVKERMVTLADFDLLTGYFFEDPVPDKNKFDKLQEISAKVLDHAAGILRKNWDGKVLEENARRYCAENNIKVGDYFMVLRLGVTGQTMTPPFWDVVSTLGQKSTLARLNSAIRIFG